MEDFNEFELLSVRELAKILRIGINSAYALVRSGAIPCVRIGRVYRIPFSSVQQFFAECEPQNFD